MSRLSERYIETRFPGAGDSYKSEWDKRFADGVEYEHSDTLGQRLLHQLCPTLYDEPQQ